MAVKLRHLEVSDVDNFQLKFHYPTFREDMLSSIEQSNREVVLVDVNDQNLLILGINYYHPGVGELWLIPSINVQKHPRMTLQITKTMIDGCLFGERKMRRLFFYVNNNWRAGHKWAKYLGFTCEGVAQAYNDKYEDYALYAKIRWVL